MAIDKVYEQERPEILGQVANPKVVRVNFVNGTNGRSVRRVRIDGRGLKGLVDEVRQLDYPRTMVGVFSTRAPEQMPPREVKDIREEEAYVAVLSLVRRKDNRNLLRHEGDVELATAAFPKMLVQPRWQVVPVNPPKEIAERSKRNYPGIVATLQQGLGVTVINFEDTRRARKEATELVKSLREGAASAYSRWLSDPDPNLEGLPYFHKWVRKEYPDLTDFQVLEVLRRQRNILDIKSIRSNRVLGAFQEMTGQSIGSSIEVGQQPVLNTVKPVGVVGAEVGPKQGNNEQSVIKIHYEGVRDRFALERAGVGKKKGKQDVPSSESQSDGLVRFNERQGQLFSYFMTVTEEGTRAYTSAAIGRLVFPDREDGYRNTMVSSVRKQILAKLEQPSDQWGEDIKTAVLSLIESGKFKTLEDIITTIKINGTSRSKESAAMVSSPGTWGDLVDAANRGEQKRGVSFKGKEAELAGYFAAVTEEGRRVYETSKEIAVLIFPEDNGSSASQQRVGSMRAKVIEKLEQPSDQWGEDIQLFVSGLISSGRFKTAGEIVEIIRMNPYRSGRGSLRPVGVGFEGRELEVARHFTELAEDGSRLHKRGSDVAKLMFPGEGSAENKISKMRSAVITKLERGRDEWGSDVESFVDDLLKSGKFGSIEEILSTIKLNVISRGKVIYAEMGADLRKDEGGANAVSGEVPIDWPQMSQQEALKKLRAVYSGMEIAYVGKVVTLSKEGNFQYEEIGELAKAMGISEQVVSKLVNNLTGYLRGEIRSEDYGGRRMEERARLLLDWVRGQDLRFSELTNRELVDVVDMRLGMSDIVQIATQRSQGQEGSSSTSVDSGLKAGVQDSLAQPGARETLKVLIGMTARQIASLEPFYVVGSDGLRVPRTLVQIAELAFESELSSVADEERTKKLGTLVAIVSQNRSVFLQKSEAFLADPTQMDSSMREFIDNMKVRIGVQTDREVVDFLKATKTYKTRKNKSN